VQILGKVVWVLILLYVCFLVALLAVMRQLTLFGRVMSKMPQPLMMVVPFKHLWLLARAGHLEVGDVAPDFSLPAGDRKTRVRLSSFRRHRPVVLIFGSYT